MNYLGNGGEELQIPGTSYALRRVTAITKQASVSARTSLEEVPPILTYF